MATTTTDLQASNATAPEKGPQRDYTNLEQVLWSKGFQKDLAHFLGGERQAAAFIAEIFNQARKVPNIHRCTISSIAHSIARVAALRLNPALPNMVNFIPRNTEQPGGGKALELSADYGYAALRTLVLRSPEITDCFTREVCVNDHYVPPPILNAPPEHTLPPRFQPRGRVEGYYALIELTNGNYRHLQMSVKDVQTHVKRYIPKPGPAWQDGTRPDAEGLTTFDKMAMKTCLRMLCNARDVPLTAEVREVMDAEWVRETAAEHQGYDRQGQRPALTASTGQPLETLLDEVSGVETMQAVAAQVQEETRPERQTTRRAATPPASRMQGPDWDLLRQFQGDARVPGDLQERIAAALGPIARATDAEAHTLASEVQEVIDAQEVVNGG